MTSAPSSMKPLFNDSMSPPSSSSSIQTRSWGICVDLVPHIDSSRINKALECFHLLKQFKTEVKETINNLQIKRNNFQFTDNRITTNSEIRTRVIWQRSEIARVEAIKDHIKSCNTEINLTIKNSIAAKLIDNHNPYITEYFPRIAIMTELTGECYNSHYQEPLSTCCYSLLNASINFGNLPSLRNCCSYKCSTLMRNQILSQMDDFSHSVQQVSFFHDYMGYNLGKAIVAIDSITHVAMILVIPQAVSPADERYIFSYCNRVCSTEEPYEMRWSLDQQKNKTLIYPYIALDPFENFLAFCKEATSSRESIINDHLSRTTLSPDTQTLVRQFLGEPIPKKIDPVS